MQGRGQVCTRPYLVQLRYHIARRGHRISRRLKLLLVVQRVNDDLLPSCGALLACLLRADLFLGLGRKY